MIYIKDNDTIHEHVSILQKDNVIITFQETPGDVFDDVRERIEKNLGRIRTMKSDYLYYSLLDALVDQYFIILNRLANVFKEAELQILENNKEEKESVYRLRKELLYLLNAIMPVKDSILTLESRQSKYFSREMMPYYTDLMEHMNQVYELLKSYKDMTVNLHEMQMANVSNDMNKIMMTLTYFSAIFIPLSFLAGVFGMNFTYMPGLGLHSGFYLFVLACVLIVFGMLMFFRSRKWL